MSKVRYIDWSPDEYIAGTFGRLSFEEHGFYIVALNLIYSSGGPIPVELDRLAYAGLGRRHTARRLLNQLIAKGKLTLTADGKLANGRADKEIHRALRRISNAVEPRLNPGSTAVQKPLSQKRLSKINAPSQTAAHIKNYQLETIISSLSESHTDAAREPAPDSEAPARAHPPPEPTPEPGIPPATAQPPDARATRQRLADITAAKRAAFLKRFGS